MSKKPEALRLSENLLNPWWGLTATPAGLPVVDPTMVTALRVSAAQMLRVLHADNDRLKGLLRDIRNDAQTSHWHETIDAELEQEPPR